MRALFQALLLSCGTLSAQNTPQPSADAANAHACDLFQFFRQMTEGNFCFSPYSSHQIAALLTVAAKGETQSELAKLAHLDANLDQGLENVAALHASLVNSARKKALTVEITHSLWTADAAVYQPAFLKSARSQLGASLEKLPAGDATTCATAVNRWVREKTHGRVPQIIGPGAFAFPSQTEVAVNTVYVRGLWAKAFDPRLTQLKSFQTPNQGAVMRRAMKMPQGRFKYSETETFQCLSLPLAGSEASLLIILPRDEPLRQKIETKLSPSSWKAVVRELQITDVNAQVPQFSYSTQLSLKGLWQTLGAKRVFEAGAADLTAALQLDRGFVSDVVQETAIEVNELGAEAAAATLAAAEPFGDSPPAAKRPPPVKNFIANRPFIWMLRHHATDLILFMGRYAGD